MTDFYSGVARRPRMFIDSSGSPTSVPDPGVNASNEMTLFHWRSEWVKNVAQNVKKFGYFNKDHSIKVFARENLNNACVLVGAGPSLEKNIGFLKECHDVKIAILASAHAFMYLAEHGIKPDFVGLLDASEKWVEYLNGDSKDVVLFADWCVSPAYFDNWQGPVYFYQSEFDRQKSYQGKLLWSEIIGASGGAIPPDPVPVGGHIGGGMLYMAKEILGSSDIIFVGFDYAFLGEKFYPWEKEIDKPSIPGEDCQSVLTISGEHTMTVASYMLFKSMVDQMVWNYKSADPKISYINATEGGILGSYPQGNLVAYDYLTLADAVALVTAQRGVRMSWGR